MSVPLVSVIVPVYNVEPYLERCVRSVLAQTFADFELLLIDDGSTDNSGTMCDAFAAKDARIRVIHKPNGGQSEARNLGIDLAVGDYIAFVDGDDYIEPNNLELLLTMLRENGCDVACGSVTNCYEGKRIPQCSERVSFVCTGEEALQKLLEAVYITGSHCGKLMTRKAIGDHRFPLGKTYEDAFFLPAVLFYSTVAVTTEPIYNYWHRQNSTTTLPFSEKAMHIIEAYEYTLDFVKTNCPSALDVANFKLYWAHFVVLDRMMATKRYRRLPQYKGVVSFLKKNWLNIVKCPYFQSSRRVAALALKVNINLYYLLSYIKRRQDGIFG